MPTALLIILLIFGVVGIAVLVGTVTVKGEILV